MARRPARKRKPDPALPILQLKIRLLDVSPMVWRRLLVPATTSLQELHGILQVAMG
ncbi:IS1096 element passenger TnpR family protein [Inquilinus sp. OTU3971]|uniref:IS1096 element passenger TnpR family protein n=1 Tax=Inquilinus sp. OTU3971 TaxID=3043855 RepID=UPI00313F2619